MLQQPKRPPVPPFNLEKVIAPVNEDEQPDLVQQYLQESNDNSADCVYNIFTLQYKRILYTYYEF